MLSPTQVYALVLSWLEALGAVPHTTGRRAIAARLTALLVGQSLAPAALMRALWSPSLCSARQRYQRVARTWQSPWLCPAWLTPVLVRAALRLAAPQGEPLLALDSVRCGPWECFTVGLVWHRRVLVIGWRVLPYPWPKGQFTPTVCALLEQVAQAWPAQQPAPHLLADRGFPSQVLFATLTRLGWGFTIRLRATAFVAIDGQRRAVRDLLAEATPEAWRGWAATYGHAKLATTAQLVLGRGLLVLPWHQRDAGSARARASRAQRRQHDLHAKHPRRRTTDRSAQTDPWVIVFTTLAVPRVAASTYRWRWAVEGSYRDAQSGWDGRHGWDLEPTLAKQTAAASVDGVVGLWALGLLLQTWVGDQIGRADAPERVRQVVAGWSTTGRLSVWTRGRFAFTEPSGELTDWLVTTLQTGAEHLAGATPAPMLKEAA
jgi:hypothetical protein